jgi:Flp pilus assembly pilin Flp
MTPLGLRSATPIGRLCAEARGAVMVEYLVLLVFVALLCAAAIAAWGPLLVQAYERTRAILISPVP